MKCFTSLKADSVHLELNIISFLGFHYLDDFVFEVICDRRPVTYVALLSNFSESYMATMSFLSYYLLHS